MSYTETPITIHSAPEHGTLAAGVLAGRPLVAFASLDHVVILDQRLKPLKILHFADGYASVANKGWRIAALCLDTHSNTIAAAIKDYVVLWNTLAGHSWRVCAAFRTNHDITALQLRKDCLIAAGTKLSVWRKPEDSTQWTRAADASDIDQIAQLRISPAGHTIVSFTKGSNIARVWRLQDAAIDLVTELYHPTSIAQVSWRTSCRPGFEILATHCSDGTFRLHSTLLDEPDCFTLFLTLQHPSTSTASKPCISILIESASLSEDQDDLALTFFQDGSMAVTELLNLERSPPTCFSQRAAHLYTDIGLRSSIVRKLATASVCHLVHNDHILVYGANKSGTMTMLRLSVDCCLGQPTPIFSKSLRRPSSGAIRRMSRSPDSRHLLTLTDNVLSLWRVRYRHGSPARLDFIASHIGICPTLAVVNNGKKVAVATEDGKILLLSATGSKLAVQKRLDLPRQAPKAILGLHWAEAGLVALREEDLLMWTDPNDQCPMVVASVSSPSCLSAPLDSGLFLLTQIDDGTQIQQIRSDATLLSVSQVKHEPARLAAYDGERHLAVLTRSAKLEIWDIFTSEFSSGRELSLETATEPFSLEWLPIRNAQPLLMTGAQDDISVYIQRRKDYFVDSQKWQLLTTVEKRNFVMSASTWLLDQSILAVEEDLIQLYPSSLAFLESSRQPTNPLPLYHPQFLEQCLIRDKLVLVSAIVEHLDQKLGLQDDFVLRAQLEDIGQRFLQAEELFDIDSTHFQSLFNKLETDTSLPLSPIELSQLRVVLQTLIEVCTQRRALDANGMRFLVSMRTFFIHHAIGKTPHSDGHGPRLRYRDMIWAYFSESQELLVQDCHQACGEKLAWPAARSLGMFLWLNSQEALTTLMDSIARMTFSLAEFDQRDPVTVSLFYLALRKKRLVQSIWKQSTQHSDRSNMVKFLANDFSEARWQTAAAKNAYALLAKQRYLFAATFFLLADKLKDAVGVIMRHLKDFQLAVAIARVYEPEGHALRSILEDHVIPQAISKGHRRLATWAFWGIGRRDLAIRAIVTPFDELARSLPKNVGRPGIAESDDPSLILLFADLRDWSLQTVKGAARISAKTEFNFVLFMASVYREMGCHLLALDLVKSWRFGQPDILPAIESKRNSDASSLSSLHRRELTLRRRSSLLGRSDGIVRVDMDTIPSEINSTAPSRASSPPPTTNGNISESPPAQKEQSADLNAANLFKRAKKIATVPEFDMNAFGYV